MDQSIKQTQNVAWAEFLCKVISKNLLERSFHRDSINQALTPWLFILHIEIHVKGMSDDLFSFFSFVILRSWGDIELRFLRSQDLTSNIIKGRQYTGRAQHSFLWETYISVFLNFLESTIKHCIKSASKFQGLSHCHSKCKYEEVLAYSFLNSWIDQCEISS